MISSRQIATEFFNNMIFAKPPKSVNEAFYIAKSKIGKIERKATTEEEIYFPGSLTVTVHKENLQN
jgi:hypothetical protein